jgi:TfoX/Sxy family transcriptional regulator of competence genes
MPWERPSPELTRALDDAVVAAAEVTGVRVEHRPMFGCPAYFAGGNMFAAAHAAGVTVRLPDDARRELAAVGGRPFEPMPGRVMRQYMVLPPSVLADAEQTAAWVRRAAELAASLPAKAKKRARRAKP